MSFSPEVTPRVRHKTSVLWEMSGVSSPTKEIGEGESKDFRSGLWKDGIQRKQTKCLTFCNPRSDLPNLSRILNHFVPTDSKRIGVLRG